MPFAEVDHLLVDAGEGAFGHDRLGVLQAAVRTPHLASVADHGGHGCIDDDVTGRMEIGDALGRVDHRQLGPVLVARMQVAPDLILFALRQTRDLVVQVDHAVVDVHPQCIEQLTMLGEGVAVEDLHAVAEHNGMRHLHHGGLYMQRKHHAGFERVFDLLLVKLQKRLLAHEHRIDDLAVLQRHLGLKHDRLAAFGDQLHFHVARFVQCHRLLAMVEIAVVHVRDVRTRGLAPFRHAMRVLARVVFHRERRAAVGIAFAQHRVHGTPGTLGVARSDRLLFVRLGALGIVRDLVTLALQLLDRSYQLRHGGADVGKLDDVGAGQQRQPAQFGQVVRHPLLLGQGFGKLAEDAGRHRDIAGGDVDAGRRCKCTHDGQKRSRGKCRCLISQRVDDGGGRCAHRLASLCGGVQVPNGCIGLGALRHFGDEVIGRRGFQAIG